MGLPVAPSAPQWRCSWRWHQPARGSIPAGLPFKPDSFFSFPWPVVLGGVALGLVAALAGAYFPSRRAAATDPARTLAG